MTRRRAAKGPRTHIGLEQRFLASLRQLEPRPGQTIVVGFSGGKDSLALAQLFARTKPVSGVEPRLLHVNHNLRPTSGQEAGQAKSLAKQLALPITVTEIEPGLVARNPGLGVEEAARRERYLALREFARKRRTDVIAIAHQCQDQAETVLLHLLRGAGIAGMMGMSELMSTQIPWWEGPSRSKPVRLWRPLLDENPVELAEYMSAHGLEPIEDPSNEDLYFSRNRIRHEILPKLEEIQPSATEAIARFAKIAALEDAFLTSVTQSAIDFMVYNHVRIDRREAIKTHPVFLRRIIKQRAESNGANEVQFERVEQVLKLVLERPGDRIIELGGGVIVACDDDWIYLGREDEVWEEVQDVYDVWIVPLEWPEDQEVEMAVDRPVTIEGMTIHASAEPATFGVHRPWRAFLPAAAFEDRLVLRRLKDGDVWARHDDKIREHLRIRNIPAFARSRVMVFASKEGVWLVPGISRRSREMPDMSEPLIYLDIRQQEVGVDI